jgi:hypothetical protein
MSRVAAARMPYISASIDWMRGLPCARAVILVYTGILVNEGGDLRQWGELVTKERTWPS